MRHRRSNRSELGASMLEYALILAIFVPVFIVGAIKIKEAAEYRADQATLTVKKFVPCAGDGSLLTGPECY